MDNEVVYENPNIASPLSMRPWFIVPIKENRTTQKILHDSFINRELDEAKVMVTDVEGENDKTFKCKHHVDPFYNDGKAVDTACGLGGAYCVVCDVSLEEGMFLNL